MTAATITSWPRLMNAATARAYLDSSVHDFRALIAAGLIPPGKAFGAGGKRWHRNELDASTDRMFEMEAAQTDAEDAEDTRTFIESYQPPSIRRRVQRAPLLPA